MSDGGLNEWRQFERFSFGDGPAMADRLSALVASGKKRATCWSVREGQQTHVGKRMVVVDGSGAPRVVIETLSLELKRFADVDLDFALSEGEGDETLEDWRAGHQAYFERNGGFSPNMLLWVERFRVVALLNEGLSV